MSFYTNYEGRKYPRVYTLSINFPETLNQSAPEVLSPNIPSKLTTLINTKKMQK